jgi:hypothetical protein
VSEPTHTPPDRRLALEAGAIMGVATAACLSCLVLSAAVFEQPAVALRTLETTWSFAAGVALVGAVLGYFNGLFHQRWIAEHEAMQTDAPAPVAGREGLLRLGVLRFWALLPFNFASIAFGVLWATLRGGSLVQQGSGIVPIWFQLGPLMRSWPTDGDFPGTPPTLQRLAQGMPRWAWWLPVTVIVATQGGEIYGEVPVLLTLGTYWVGDYLAMWWVLRARVLLAPRNG